jgi:hypothetical protein
VGAAINSVDVVGEGVGRFTVGVVVLQSYFHHAGGHFPLHVERLLVHHRTVAVEVPHKGDDAALEEEGHLPVVTLVDQRQLQATRQVRRLPEPLHQVIEAVVQPSNKDLGISQEGSGGAVVVVARRPHHLHRTRGNPALVLLAVNLAVAANFHAAPLG